MQETLFLPPAKASHTLLEDGKRHIHLDNVPEQQTASGSSITLQQLCYTLRHVEALTRRGVCELASPSSQCVL